MTLECSIICNLLSCILRLWLLNGHDPLISEGIRLCSDMKSRGKLCVGVANKMIVTPVGEGHMTRKFQLLSSLLNLINSNGNDTSIF